MRKNYKLLILLIALAVIIGNISFNEVAIAIEDQCYNEGSFRIYAGKTKLVGIVNVKLYQDKIIFDFDLDDGVTASEYHINILDNPPTDKGSPGLYPYSGSQNTSDFTVEISHNFVPGQTIYVMTHLSVEGTNASGEK